jgi:hypothetical protein
LARRAVEPVSSNPNRSGRVGVGCEVAPFTEATLRSRPSRHGRRVASIDAGDVVWVELVDRRKGWVLVEGNDGRRGWLKLKEIALSAPREPRTDGKERTRIATGDAVFEVGMAVSPRERGALLADKPGSERGERARAEVGQPLHVLGIRVVGGSSWLLTESEQGRWGWLEASNAEPAEQGIAIVDTVTAEAAPGAQPGEDAAVTAPAPAPTKGKFNFGAEVDLDLAFPIKSSIETGDPRYRASVKGILSRNLSPDWLLVLSARFRVSLASSNSDGMNKQSQSQSFDLEIDTDYSASDTITLSIGGGYSLAITSKSTMGGPSVLESSNGPFGNASIVFKLGSRVRLSDTVALLVPFETTSTRSAFSPAFFNQVTFRVILIEALSALAFLQTTRVGDTTAWRTGLGVRYSF